MAEKIGSIYYDLDLDDKKFKSGMKGAQKETRSLAGAFGDAQMASFAFLGAITAVGAATIAFGIQSIKTAARLETMRAGFITLLGSAKAADKTMARVKKEASRTPFEIAGLTQSVQLLSSITKDGDEAIDIVLDIGESLAAMGKGQAELDRISVNLQQIGAVGKASMLDIKQFAYAGIPIFEMIQEETGLTGDALSEFVDEGGLTFDRFAGMFDKATSKGGRFFGAFENQAGTFDQLWSNMKDTISIFGAELVMTSGIFDLAKDAVAFLTEKLGALKLEFENAGGVVAYLSQKFEENKLAVFIIAGAIVGALIPAFVSLGVSIWTALLPIIPFILIGAALAAAIYYTIEALGGWEATVALLKEKMNQFTTWITEVAWPAILDFWNGLKDAIIGAWNTIYPIMVKIGKVFLWLWDYVIYPVGYLIFSLIAWVAEKILQHLVGTFNTLKQHTLFVWDKIRKHIIDPLMNALVWIEEKFDISTKLQIMWEWIVKYFRDHKDEMVEALLAPFRQVKTDIETVANDIKGLADKINPLHRESPSLADWVAKGTARISGLYNDMFDSINRMNVAGNLNIAGAGADLMGSISRQTPSNVNISLNPSGIVARSRGELRDIASDMIGAVNEELRSRNLPEVGGGKL